MKDGPHRSGTGLRAHGHAGSLRSGRAPRPGRPLRRGAHRPARLGSSSARSHLLHGGKFFPALQAQAPQVSLHVFQQLLHGFGAAGPGHGAAWPAPGRTLFRAGRDSASRPAAPADTSAPDTGTRRLRPRPLPRRSAPPLPQSRAPPAPRVRPLPHTRPGGGESGGCREAAPAPASWAPVGPGRERCPSPAVSLESHRAGLGGMRG